MAGKRFETGTGKRQRRVRNARKLRGPTWGWRAACRRTASRERSLAIGTLFTKHRPCGARHHQRVCGGKVSPASRAFDLPGHGLSGRPDASYTLRWYAHIMARWFEALHLDTVDVVGHSFGGGVATLRPKRACVAGRERGPGDPRRCARRCIMRRPCTAPRLARRLGMRRVSAMAGAFRPAYATARTS